MSLADRVAALLREVAAAAVMPRFQALGRDDVTEKSPGELVTVADREAERLIAAGLASLRPGTRVVGEEACSRTPALLDQLGAGDAWLVDPIDGTANFAAGQPPFAMMVALLRGGDTVGAWVLNPLSGSIVVAERGSGAWRDGRRLAAAPARATAELSGIASPFFRPPEGEAIVARIGQNVAALRPSRRCAGAEYPMVAEAAADFALYWRTLPWDHAAGALLVEEAGGAVLRLDGRRYRAAGSGTGLIVASRPETAEKLLSLATAEPTPPA